jgi:hypothetical protein
MPRGFTKQRCLVVSRDDIESPSQIWAVASVLQRFAVSGLCQVVKFS